MVEMIEVEIKIKLSDNPDELSKIVNLLERDGFHLGTITRETDVYFNSKTRDFRKTDEALRLRRTENLGSGYLIADNELSDGEVEVLSEITYKGKKLDDISMSRLELSSRIVDYDDMKAILEALGYYPVTPVVKKRKYYHGEEMVACIDDVEGLGNYMELEIIVDDESKREKALGLIEKQLERLGLSMEDTTTISYLSMLERRTI